MYKKIISGIMLTLLLVGMFSLAVSIQSVESESRTIIVPDDYPTIQAAVDVARSGDVIYVRSGIYYENVRIYGKYNLSLIGEDKYTTIIDGNGTGSVILLYGWMTRGIKIANFTIRNSGTSTKEEAAAGILSYWLSGGYNIIVDNIIESNDNGICLLMDGGGNIIYGNLINANNYGILASLSGGNQIENNIITRNNIGISMWSGGNIILNNNVSCNNVNVAVSYYSGNIVASNYISNGGTGLQLWYSSYNHIFQNTIVNNSYGIKVQYYSNYSKIYHNNFINNSRQANQDESSLNFWDNDYPSGGNYWSDYVDLWLFLAVDENGDGIWDRPYFSEYFIDRYPLVSPWGAGMPINASIYIDHNTLNLKGKGRWITAYIELPEGYDVANVHVYSIRLNDAIPADLEAPTEIGDYDNDTITDLMVKFNRTAVCEYITSLNIEFGNVTLAISGRGYNVTLFEGSSIIKVSSLLGDVNCDGIVDISDIIQAAASFDSKEGDPDWNPNANYAPPYNIIDIFDLVTIAIHYGQTYP